MGKGSQAGLLESLLNLRLRPLSRSGYYLPFTVGAMAKVARLVLCAASAAPAYSHPAWPCHPELSSLSHQAWGCDVLRSDARAGRQHCRRSHRPRARAHSKDEADGSLRAETLTS